MAAGALGVAMGYKGMGVSNPVAAVLSVGVLSLGVGIFDTAGALYSNNKSPHFAKINAGSNFSLIGIAILAHGIKCSIIGGALYLGGYSLGKSYSSQSIIHINI